MVRALLGASVLALLNSTAASAQRALGVRHAANKPAACRVDTTAAWYTKQRAWADERAHAWSDDAFRAALTTTAGLDAASLPVQLGWEIQGAESPSAMTADSAMRARLLGLATTRGSVWPTKSIVGAAGTRAVWLLAQRDTALMRASLKRMMEAGPEESNAADVAMLEDRLRLVSGRKQLYATQFRAGPGGQLVLAPMEDSAHVDLRREDAGLPPFEVSVCLARRTR